MMGWLSIRYKFLALTALLLLLSVGTYLGLATQVFKTDKTEFVFDYNRSLVTNIAAEMESFFQSVSDKIKLIAFFSQRPREEKEGLLKDLMLNSPDIVFVAESSRFEDLSQVHYTSEEYLKTYNLASDFLEKQLPRSRPIPFQRILREGEAIWNATVENGAPLIGFGRSIFEETNDGRPLRQYALIAFVRSDRLYRALKQSPHNELLIANTSGEILAHLNAAVVLEKKSGSQWLDKMIKSPMKASVLHLERNQKKFLGAFAKTFNNQLLVVSQISEERAFAVVDRLLYRSLAFALMVLALAFIMAIVFSRSLTRPLDVLMQGMRKVAQGDLSTRIDIKSRDEIQTLARSYNDMIVDLKESRQALEEINRDLEQKVKDRTQQLELQNQAVKNAQEALLRTTRLAAVGEIAGRAAHEVLNPLTSILSRLEIMRDRLRQSSSSSLATLHDVITAWDEDFKKGGWQELFKKWQEPSSVFPEKMLIEEDLTNLKAVDSQVGEVVETVSGDTDFLYREGMRINKIVQSMRGLSIQTPEKKSWALPEMLAESAAVMQDWVSQFSTTINLEEIPAVEVEVDRDEFLQVMTNLLRNSTQSIDQRRQVSGDQSLKGVIDLSVILTGDKIEISIVDNGIGVDPENQSRLFESQFSTKTRDQGTGLGLNIARRFMRAVGGDIRFISSRTEPARTEFRIELPLPNQRRERRTA